MIEGVLLSIIVPVYNVEKYLSDCLNSLIDQAISKERYEIICIDDGSTDDSWEILKAYARNYNNIKVYHKENGGVSSARNDRLMYAAGKFIWFVGFDDYTSVNSIDCIVDELFCCNLDVLQIG